MTRTCRLQGDRCHRMRHDIVQLTGEGEPLVLEGERCFGGELFLAPSRRLGGSEPLSGGLVVLPLPRAG
jgi:hypothetical protein